MTDLAEAQDHEAENKDDDVTEAKAEETKARDMGWRPESEWSGDKERWMPADEFIGRNDRLKARGDSIAKAENAKLTAQVGELTKTMDDLKGYMTRAEQGAYKRALTDIKAEQRQAVADGDTEAFDAAAEKAEALEVDAKKATAKPKADAPSPDEDPEFTTWLTDNPWYDPKDDGLDLEMRAFANQIAPEAAAAGLKGKSLYDRITKEVKKKFPDNFGNAKRRKAAAVEGAGAGGGGGGPKKGYSDLPADAKATCDRLVKEKVWDRPSQKLELSEKQARARYASDYFEEEE